MTDSDKSKDDPIAKSDSTSDIVLSHEIIEIALRRLVKCRANPAAMLTEEELWHRVDSKRKPRK